jgi:hypothetical protein
MTSVEQIKIFKKSADTIFNTGDYTSATILYFKTLFAIEDFLLLQKIGYSPKDHTERFSLLKKNFPDAYKLVDMEFNTYRDTYSKLIGKQTCLRIKMAVENEIRTNKIF